MEAQKLAPIRDKGNFELETLASMPSFYFPTLSHNKDKLAFYWDKTGRNELYIMDLTTRKIEQISNGEIPKALRAGFIWSRDDTKILFAKDKDGDEQHNIHLIDLETKKVSMLTNTPDFQEYIVDSSPDGKWYSFVSNRNGQMNVFRISIDGETVEQITAHENPAFGGKFSPDGKFLVYSTNEEKDLRNSDIYLAKTDGTHAERIIQVKVGSSDNFADWSKDERYIAFTTDASGIAQPAIYDLETKEIRFLGDGKHEQYAGKFSENGKFMVGMQNIEGSISPVIFDLETGETKELDFPKGIAAGTQLKDDRYLFLTINTPTMPSQLIMFDLDTQKSEILLNTDTKGIDPSLFIEGEHIWYPSLDGTMIPAIIYKPRDFDPTYKYPAIVLPHGGPTGQYFMNFSMMAQYLADLGYVVLLPNVRGSTGYGVEFRDACLKDWGGKDHDDWVAGRQYIIDNYSVDPNRVAVFGGSYGGYATLVCLTKSPDLWAAGCAWVPVSHLKNMYEKSMPHFKYFLRMQMGDPVEDAELWEERSPLNFVENIKAPLLLVHGTNDPRCPVTESRNVRDRLLELGRKEGKDGDFEFVEYTDEGHGAMSDIQGRIRSMKLFTDFLKRRLSN